MALRCEPNRPWLEAEDLCIIENTGKLNSLQIGRLLGRTSAATKARSRVLNVYVRTKVDKSVKKVPKPKSLEMYLLASIEFDTNGGCWLWPSLGRYGVAKFNGVTDLAHRASWKTFRGEIPNGLNVLHKCDVMPCCNPDHLFLGTPKDNTQDMMRKGRGVKRLGELNTQAVLSAEDVLDIRARIIAGEKQYLIARHYGVTPATICDIKYRRSWMHL